MGMNFLLPFVCFLVMRACYNMKPMWLVCNVILIPSFSALLLFLVMCLRGWCPSGSKWVSLALAL